MSGRLREVEHNRKVQTASSKVGRDRLLEVTITVKSLGF